MEYVARDLKALGLYIARSISYEGIEYNPVEHELSTHQHDTYNKTAETWQKIVNPFHDSRSFSLPLDVFRIMAAIVWDRWRVLIIKILQLTQK